MSSPIRTIFEQQKTYFSSDTTKSYEWRMDQLTRLETMLQENQEMLTSALGKDFKTAWFEQSMEFHGTLGAVADAKAELKKWMTPENAPLSKRLEETGHRAVLYREPYGVSLIIAPFNAPIILTLEPLIAALAAGNTAIVKPAESTMALSEVYEALFAKYFDPCAVALVRGDRELVSELLSFPFDFIFFTGSTSVGKVVMKAAAEHLTPVLLELGGQNPVVVDRTANVKDAAEKLVWGATAFGGQWCVSPGYVYVHEAVADIFVDACRLAITTLYGADPKASPDFSRIVSQHDAQRIVDMLVGANIVAGGEHDIDARYVAPTVVYPANWTDGIMASEIFGPVLPILPYSDLDDVIDQIKQQPKSLAAYIFSRDEATVSRFLHAFSFGGGAVNQTMLQCLLSSSLPFGGVGASGLGRYYGKYGFDSLSHLKSVVYASADTRIDALLPPYNLDKAQELGDWFAPPR